MQNAETNKEYTELDYRLSNNNRTEKNLTDEASNRDRPTVRKLIHVQGGPKKTAQSF